jgi:uncharacterized PurR-regulated membrane protein YhhQ (DUF165 family)
VIRLDPVSALLSAVYIAAICAANLLVVSFGPEISVLNAFVLIGMDLSLRDALHDRWRKHRALRMTSLIAIAGALSWAINPAAGAIAVASAVAFVAAALVDWSVYHFMRKHQWNERANASNIAGAAVDSFVFPALAFGFPLLWPIILGQFTAKVAGGAVWALVIGAVRRRRAAAHG